MATSKYLNNSQLTIDVKSATGKFSYGAFIRSEFVKVKGINVRWYVFY